MDASSEVDIVLCTQTEEHLLELKASVILNIGYTQTRLPSSRLPDVCRPKWRKWSHPTSMGITWNPDGDKQICNSLYCNVPYRWINLAFQSDTMVRSKKQMLSSHCKTNEKINSSTSDFVISGRLFSPKLSWSVTWEKCITYNIQSLEMFFSQVYSTFTGTDTRKRSCNAHTTSLKRTLPPKYSVSNKAVS